MSLAIEQPLDASGMPERLTRPERVDRHMQEAREELRASMDALRVLITRPAVTPAQAQELIGLITQGRARLSQAVGAVRQFEGLAARFAVVAGKRAPNLRTLEERIAFIEEQLRAPQSAETPLTDTPEPRADNDNEAGGTVSEEAPPAQIDESKLQDLQAQIADLNEKLETARAQTESEKLRGSEEAATLRARIEELSQRVEAAQTQVKEAEASVYPFGPPEPVAVDEGFWDRIRESARAKEAHGIPGLTKLFQEYLAKTGKKSRAEKQADQEAYTAVIDRFCAVTAQEHGDAYPTKPVESVRRTGAVNGVEAVARSLWRRMTRGKEVQLEIIEEVPDPEAFTVILSQFARSLYFALLTAVQEKLPAHDRVPPEKLGAIAKAIALELEDKTRADVSHDDDRSLTFNLRRYAVAQVFTYAKRVLEATAKGYTKRSPERALLEAAAKELRHLPQYNPIDEAESERP